MPKQVSEENIEEIRRSNDIVDVIGDYIQLKKQGRNFFGLCPFHGEQTPSFSVTQEKQIFHCFGCGKGGNVITFIMEMEGYTFYEALRLLSDKSGIELPEVSDEQKSSISMESQSILSASEWIAKLYHHLLRYTKDGNEGYRYFKDRGIEDDTIDAFQLGFAPNVKDFTAEFLKKKGFHQQILVKAGLLSLTENNIAADRFRSRVIFPIRNHLGKTVAFGGRTISDQEPKYLNSPESELFQKGKLLYNFDLAKKHIRKQSEAVLFEGYMDVISAYQAGVKNAVATLGTSLTDSQARLLRRYVDTVIICYDADAAGNEAAYKAAELLKKTGCQVKIANLRENMDPDDFITEFGAEQFQQEVIKSSLTFTNFYMRYLKKNYNLTLEGDRIQYIEKVLEYLATVDSSVEREYYLQEINDAYNVSMDSLKQEIAGYRQRMGIGKDKINKNRYTNRAPNDNYTKKLLPAFQNAERQLIAYMLQDASVIDKVQEEIGASFNVDDHKIIATYLYAYYEDHEEPDVSMFVEMLEDDRLKQLVTEIAMIPVYDNITHDEINDYIKTILVENSNKQDVQTLKEEQRIAEQQNDPIKAAEIAMQIIELQKQWKKIK
ncbi:DNA primase [Lentibacillus amyloliquefaciens]|uniref:DNA primase n=1 Tax=Lentibacillus amyloliquefaciens TaxID=1472767 RepID=A0A0U4E4A4_9BACI|nr:DNA primase [Lentibacillus amyloliquefaciens]ALX48108.1 DNA primase [Lentibacillus amyloliquefaciens]